MKRILIFSLAYPPFVGGAELAIKEITDRINDCSFDMITCNLDGQKASEERLGNVRVYRIGRGKISKYFFPLSAYRTAKKLHHKQPYDIVWAVMANQAGLAALFFKFAYPKINYLLTLQEGDSVLSIWLRTWFMRPLYKAIYRRADHIQAISSFLANRAKKYGYRKEISIIPNGVDVKNFSQSFSDTQKTELKTALGLNIRKPVIISVSRLVKKNGMDILVKAMHEVDAELLLLGVGEQARDLQVQANQLGIAHRVHFLGHVSHRELPRYLSIADIFVRPSRSEGLGSAFLEAMAAGLPIVAPLVGGISDFLIDGETGLVCKYEDPSDVAKKINQILRDQGVRNRLQTQGRSLVEHRYNWERVVDAMKGIITRL